MALILRKILDRFHSALERGKSILLIGPRQTGKTTLVQGLEFDLYINLAQANVRQDYERDPGRLAREVEAMAAEKKELPLIVIDEVQKVTVLLDAVQDLIDSKLAQFVLTGSSARKLRREGDVNLLPGRVVVLRMDPLTITELLSQPVTINDLLLYGSLPHIVLEESLDNREEDLFSYVTTYLEEEIRSEALVRNIGAFSNFLRLAAVESGKNINFNKLSQDIGVASSTIGEYYQILVDCLVAERVEALSQSRTRKRLVKSPKFLIYDLGVRRITAGEGRDVPDKYMGDLFEQWVGLELLRLLRAVPQKSSLFFWRDQAGVEVDWVVEKEGQYIPIEVKWTEHPSPRDARHLSTFLSEYSNSTQGYVVCRAARAQKLLDNVLALPWKDLYKILET